MDKSHRTVDRLGRKIAVFDIFSDKDLGGNHFASTGAMGDWGDITLDAGSTNFPFEGLECIRVDYAATGAQGFNWAGVYWQYPGTNWGTIPGSYNLEGAKELRFRARGAKGGEKLEFKVGGINKPPYNNATFPYQDSCDLLTTGPVSLTPDWREYVIDLEKPELFWIYKDHLSRLNHYIPSGWMGDDFDLSVDEHWTNRPFSGDSCVRITYSADKSRGQGWAGIYWQALPNNWGSQNGSYDLSGATKLTFYARASYGTGLGQNHATLHLFLFDALEQHTDVVTSARLIEQLRNISISVTTVLRVSPKPLFLSSVKRVRGAILFSEKEANIPS